MNRTTFKFCVVFSIVSPSLAVVNARSKYSLEQEALKMYGQDYQTVLQRFRRTPEYLKILQDKWTEIKASSKDIGIQIFHYTHGLMEDRVNRILLSSNQDPSTNEGKHEKPPVFFHAHGFRRQMTDLPNTSSDSSEKDTAEALEAQKNAKKRLEEYKVFQNALSVEERNSMRDLGFELAGFIIKTMLEHLGVTKSDKNTDGPEQPEKRPTKGSTTTEYPITHHETKESSSTTSNPKHMSTLAGDNAVDPSPPENPSFRSKLNEVSPQNGTHTIYIA